MPRTQQHILILDLKDRSGISTKKVSDAPERPGQAQWSFEIPTAPTKKEDCWDLFMTTNGNSSSVQAVKPSNQSEQGQFIGRLDLEQLGFWDRRKRRDGKLRQARIVNT